MANTIGGTNLNELIKNMEPVLNEGAYVFASLTNSNLVNIPRAMTICEMKEKEGITVVVSKENAIQLGLPVDFIMSWITLNVHSSLEAVGLTAAFATVLGKNNISCNVIAGFYHDHIFVGKKDDAKAMKVLWEMTKS